MKIGLIDVDGHNFPNLALMRISAYHKARGDTVEWWWSDFVHYDVVYKSKIFSDAYSQDVPDPMNVDKIIKGGTGYCISTNTDGVEVFNAAKNTPLPPEVEAMRPDYSIYPEFDFAVSMTSRGCPRGCSFCHVAAKEGRRSLKVANVSDFWTGQKEIEVMDPNITACADKRELFRQYRETGATICFNQGLDIRLLNDADIDDLNAMRLKKVHFAWDDPRDDLAGKFENYAKRATHKPKGKYGMVYILTNYGSSMADNLRRIYTVSGLGFDPYVMIYNGAITKSYSIRSRIFQNSIPEEDKGGISHDPVFDCCFCPGPGGQAALRKGKGEQAVKITVELPESTLAVTMTYVWRDPADRMTISCAIFEENEVKDGGTAKFPKHYTEGVE